jgi:hypothetical protein
MDQYKLGAKFCRKSLKKGGVSIFVRSTLQFSNINLDEFCKEQDIEACAVRINISSLTICIISIYKSPMGNFAGFFYIPYTPFSNSYTTTQLKLLFAVTLIQINLMTVTKKVNKTTCYSHTICTVL